MGKKKSAMGLGRALIKERLNAGRGNKRGDTWVTFINATLFNYSYLAS